jgi:hypothetical protein
MAAEIETAKLYAVALFAMMQERRVETDAGIDIAVPVRMDAWAISTNSPDEAGEQGLARALELWPVAEGWFGHQAKVAEIILQPQIPTIELEDSLPERIM